MDMVIWPFVFVSSVVYAISTSIKDEEPSIKHVMLASISLLIILAGTSPLMYE
ncbi:hypothetical protein [Gracilibacillus oryzae]|uniref:hypothetical protein n=1 Tax=Gracilibacillus oryzae TaxID=1672701 RepID=UPI00129750DC|nr:hypothetical protein [Gracilibacillus oryzae]